MNILFILPVPPMSRKIYVAYHQGIAQLSSLAKEAGHRTSLIMTSSAGKEKISAHLSQFRPDLVAFSVCTPQFSLARDLTRIVAGETDAPVIWGGAHPTVAPEESLRVKGVAGVVRGEGEKAFENILSGKDLIHRPSAAGFQVDPLPGPVTLEALPFGDRAVFNYSECLQKYGRLVGAEFLASRGCPFNCSYCLNAYLNKLYDGKYYRRRSPDNILTEIDSVMKHYPNISLIGFHDDTFTVDRDWLEAFCEAYSRRFNVPFWCNVRPGTLEPRDWKTLRGAGLSRVHIAIESGSERIRKDVLGRLMSDEEIISCFAGAAALGIRTVAFNMIGLPEERAEDFRKTIRLNRIIRPDWLILSVFNPYPGTALYEKCGGKKLAPEEWPASFYINDFPLKGQWMSREDLVFFSRNFVRLVYE